MKGPSYLYRALVNCIEDGDGVVLDIDLGLKTWRLEENYRLIGINAREKAQPGGMEARANLAALLPPRTEVMLQSIKPDKYGGRWLGKVTLPNGRDLAEVLVDTHWAAPWDGRGERPLPPWPRPEDLSTT